MTAAILFSVFKIFIMIVILCAMILILMGIGQLLHSDEICSDEDVSSLKKELKEKENVIGENSVFNNFLVKNNTETRKGYKK